MSFQTNSPPSRFVGLDLHKDYVVVAAVDAHQQILLKPRRISLDDLPNWAQQHLGPNDAAALEATANAWLVYDLLSPIVGRCVVANPLQVKWIAAAAVKTDPHDALRLAKLLAANLIPEVWVPPKPVRELRALIAHRRQLVKHQTRLKNQLHSILHRHHIHLPKGNPFAARNQPWWRQRNLSPSEQLRLHQTLDTLTHTQQQLHHVEQELRRLSTQQPWNHLVPFLIQLPGFGLLTTMTVLAAIGDIARFPSPKHLVGYAGLGAGVHHSGHSHRGKGITKQGHRDLRHALIEAAWVAVHKSPHWKVQFQRLTRRKHPNVAIVAIARKILVALWHILTRRVADHNAQPERVAFKLMAWSWRLTREQRGGLTSSQFVRYGLLRLELGDDLTYIRSGQTRRPIAPPQEVIALCPELQPSI